jgi:Zn-dependent peptidase ImmA (M78 family)
MYRSGHGKAVEDEADALAADLLMPRRIIAQFRVAGLNNVEDLAAKFDVSVPAIKRRLAIRGNNRCESRGHHQSSKTRGQWSLEHGRPEEARK